MKGPKALEQQGGGGLKPQDVTCFSWSSDLTAAPLWAEEISALKPGDQNERDEAKLARVSAFWGNEK